MPDPTAPDPRTPRFDLDRLMELWTVPPDRRPDALGDFARAYADPVVINSVPFSLADLVERARGLHRAFTDHAIEIVDVAVDGSKVAFAFRHRARHTGTWATPVGEVSATDREVNGVGIDILTVEDGLITRIWVLADELQRLQQVGALGVT
jgi:hypothetical protein